VVLIERDGEDLHKVTGFRRPFPFDEPRGLAGRGAAAVGVIGRAFGLFWLDAAAAIFIGAKIVEEGIKHMKACSSRCWGDVPPRSTTRGSSSYLDASRKPPGASTGPSMPGSG